jgi:uncharacterized integral membrane protein
MKYSIVLIIILVLALIFAVQNHDNISINFLAWSFQLSESIVIIVTLLFGFICGWLIILARVWKHKRTIKDLNRQLNDKFQNQNKPVPPSGFDSTI